jgi:threonine dehydratase
VVTIEDILKARERIEPYIHRTPLIHSQSLSSITGADVFIKAENLQKTGAFKVRGAFNRMIGLNADTVITASMGNHGQAVAFAARETGVKARIVMPANVSIIKEEAAKNYGAEVILRGAGLKEALGFALSQRESVFIHPFDDDEVMAGQGTIGLEITDELKGVDALLVPVGGGGLIAGIAAAVKGVSPETQVIGVVAESAPSAFRSFRDGKIVGFPPRPSIADGIAVGKIGKGPFRIIREMVDDIIVAGENAIALGVLLFMERMKLVVEGAGAAPLGALLSQSARFKNKRVVLIASGGNIDFTVIDRIVRKGLVMNGRIAIFEVVVDDIPGSLRDITAIIAGQRANILDVSHNRLTESLPLGKTVVTFTVEARSGIDLEKLFTSVRSAGFAVRHSNQAPTHDAHVLH